MLGSERNTIHNFWMQFKQSANKTSREIRLTLWQISKKECIKILTCRLNRQYLSIIIIRLISATHYLMIATKTMRIRLAPWLHHRQTTSVLTNPCISLRNHTSGLILMQELYSPKIFLKASPDLISIKLLDNWKALRISQYHNQSRRITLVDIAGSSLLMNRALWRLIWLWVPWLSKTKKLTLLNLFPRWKRSKFSRIIPFQEYKEICNL